MMYEGLKEYKGYTIAKLAAKDYWVIDEAGEKIAPSRDSEKASFRLQREAKAYIDELVKKESTEEKEEKEINKRTITLNELTCSTYSRKDDSVRGCSCVATDELKIGDEIVIDNYYTLIVEEEKKMSKGTTVKELREEAKKVGIKGASRMKKEDLLRVLMGNGKVKVQMYAFTGMYIGEFDADVTEKGTIVNTQLKGELMFNKDGVEITSPERARYANRIVEIA